MQQLVDHDYRRASRDPSLPARISPEKEVSQRHKPDLASDPVDAAQWLQESLAHPLTAIRCFAAWVCCRQPPVDPADEVVLTVVADEQEQRVRSLDQAPLVSGESRKRGRRKVLRLGAGALSLAIAAIGEAPIIL